MKKLCLFLAATLCAASMSLNVQAEVLTFDFEGTNPTIPDGWVNDPTYPWIVVNNAPEGFGGTYCIKSGNGGINSSSSTLEATFTFATTGSISFDAACWGEDGESQTYDKCEFFIDGEEKFSLGEVHTWENKSFEVSAGTHVFRWVYTKDVSVSHAEDAFFVDNIVVDLGDLSPTVEEDGWVHYDNGTFKNSIGLSSSDPYYWGIKIPAGTVTDTYLTEVAIVEMMSTNLTLYIYQGGETPAGGTLLREQEVSLKADPYYQEILLTPSVEIDPTQNIWIVFGGTGYVVSYCEMENAVDGRWFTNLLEGDWYDMKDLYPSYHHVAWMIRGLFSSDYLPCILNVDAKDITSNSANIAWEGVGDLYELRYKKHFTQINNSFQESIGDWTTIDADGDGYTWEFQDFTYGDGLGSASFINNIGALTPNNYLVSPRLTIGDSITFEVMGIDQNDYQEHFGIAVSTTSNTDPGAFTTIWEETLDEDAKHTWKKYTVDLSAYKGQEGYVAFRHFDCTSLYWMIVKDAKFYPLQEVKPDSEWTVVSNLNEAAYALSELEPNQEYWVQLRASHGEATSDWSKTFKFFTLEDETGIEEVLNQKSNITNQKLMIDGHLFILRDNHLFTPQGARVK